MNKMSLKVERIHKDAILPRSAHSGDAGLDLYSVENIVITPGESALIKTGIKIELPEQTEAQVRPRSGLALKFGITVLNTPGTIDEGYRGEVGVILINHSKNSFTVEKGMKIAQMVVKPVWKVDIIEVEKLSSSERAEGGFGSTGLR
ncbi:dUTP diphosphatase [Clostridium gasigenes]|uniref:Deoxyuridine 5'-triphosphate nucleotidohydrolase n=1 Tax=Clostridium gasigenes TaxID=94869 RepID=A0A1H0UR51_9CLOT|nr:dUTP diphosphatase [Clostridium gasigenes]MBB6624422.1 dUTP diphosphatase [Clostridium gasigenes]MBU3088683.1 dUTP diphosphatase [Clostridium gasigenes]MBU3132222.1 dUTP diphosphatase [Clostridium gasigenes]SDP68644.1 deoxyuridine 5'-triphosphate nucleotidohydrolase [Clostridium gasigenes]